MGVVLRVLPARRGEHACPEPAGAPCYVTSAAASTAPAGLPERVVGARLGLPSGASRITVRPCAERLPADASCLPCPNAGRPALIGNAALPHTVVVTGVSSGIGLETARLLCARGMRVFGTVLPEVDAGQLQGELGPGFTPLVLDVRDGGAIAQAAERVRSALAGERLFGLVNNAAVALPGPALIQPLSELRDQVAVNLLGPIIVTRAFAPLLGTDHGLSGPPGRIVMMSSISGVIGQPFMSGYCAAKHGLEGFAESLRRELRLFGIGVVLIAPTTVATPIWNTVKPFIGRYADTPYGRAFDRALQLSAADSEKRGMPPAKVAETVWLALTTRRPRLRYAPGRIHIRDQWLPRALPRRAVDAIMGLALGLRAGR